MERKKLNVPGAGAVDIGNINVLLGRNGAGKSRYLRNLDKALSAKNEFKVRYISPERAGVFQRDGSTLTNMEQDDMWLSMTRRRNQADKFKTVSAHLLRDVETAYLRRLQDTPEIRSDSSKNFRTERIERINALMSNIRIEQQGSDFVFKSLSGEDITPDQISSGESESVSLATEIMYFFENLDFTKFNLLLIDEPDVHLHPDMQTRLMHFLVQSLEDLSGEQCNRVAVFIATHSTPLVAALSSSRFVQIGTKDFDNELVRFRPVDENIKKSAPFFGHPLSLSLSNDVILILEGKDDERVWQQASRSSNSRIKVFPVIAESVDVQGDMERFCETMLTAIYDEPVAYSIRDGDGIMNKLDPMGPVVRFRLCCYAIENTLVTDECLDVLGLTWEEFRKRAKEWVEKNAQHPNTDLLNQLVKSADRLRHKKIKKIRQIICDIAGSNKPWEVLVGQTIARLDSTQVVDDEGCLAAFLGLELVNTIISPPKGDESVA